MWNNEGDTILDTSAKQGLEWKFSSPDAPWQNGAAESLVKSVKKAIHFALHEQRLSPTEFSCILYEISNSINERPIGTQTSTDSELSIITPNCLLLGRGRSKNPGGWQPVSESTILKRYRLVQEITDVFWKQWLRTCAPSLLLDPKWHSEHRDLRIGDIVLVMDTDAIRAEYRLAVVKEVYPGADGKVRKVMISYRRYKVKDSNVQYTGSTEQNCIRAVQRLALIVPRD